MGEIKLKNLFAIMSLLSIIAVNLLGQQTSLPNQSAPNFKAGTALNLPKGNCQQIVVDGKFYDNEWSDAIQFALPDNYNLLLLADDEILAVGVKFPNPMGELVCEIRFTSNEQDVFLLHSSGALGEGVLGFPATTKFELHNNKLWEANYSTKNSEREAAWIAAGSPIKRYDEAYHKHDGIEFKISRKKIASDTLKFTIGWIRVEIKDGKPDFKRYNYPAEAGLSNSGNWAKLILPVAIGNHARPGNFLKPTRFCLCQSPPGLMPEPFAAAILSSNNHPHGHLTFSNDGRSVYWSAMLKDGPEQTIFFSNYDGESLTKPAKAPFAADSGNGGPTFSFNHQRIYFSAKLPGGKSGSKNAFGICYTEWGNSGWGAPVLIESTMDTLMTKGQVAVAKNGNLYFSGRIYAERLPAIYLCTNRNEVLMKPEKLKGAINEAGLLVDPWIDPEERFLLCSIPGESGPPMLTDIGISYRQSDGTWGKAVRIGGKVNTPYFERFPSLSPDGQFLFFIRSTSERFVGEGAHFYWVSAKIIEELRSKE